MKNDLFRLSELAREEIAAGDHRWAVSLMEKLRKKFPDLSEQDLSVFLLCKSRERSQHDHVAGAASCD